MTPQEAEERVHEACPCRTLAIHGYSCQNGDDGWCVCHKSADDELVCEWFGHQAARDLRKACAERALDVLNRFGPLIKAIHTGQAVYCAVTEQNEERISKEGE